RCSPGVPAEQHSPVCNHARVNTSQPPVPPLCLTSPALRGYQKWLSAPALRGYWKIDIDSLSSSCTTFVTCHSHVERYVAWSPLRLRWPHRRLYKEVPSAPEPLLSSGRRIRLSTKNLFSPLQVLRMRGAVAEVLNHEAEKSKKDDRSEKEKPGKPTVQQTVSIRDDAADEY
ncbi:hypothetical protein MRX96_049077, partial [Rhipicephalus microplus]